MLSPNTGKHRPEETPYLDIFHAVNDNDNNDRSRYMIDVTCPFDPRVKERELSKIKRYQELKWKKKDYITVARLRLYLVIILGKERKKAK